jgi:hypothetical protein
MSSTSHVARRSALAIAALAVALTALLAAPALSFAAASPLRPATKGVSLFAKSSDAARADAARFLKSLPADGVLADWRGATVSQSIPVQGSDGSIAVYVVTFTTGGRYAGYATIDALPSANPVLEFSRNPAPVFASDTVAQASVGVAKSAPRVKRQVYLGPLTYAVETVATSGVTDAVPTGALIRPTSADAIRGPPATSGSVGISSLGTTYKLIANMADYDQFTYNYTSSEYTPASVPAAAGAYAVSPYLNAGSYYSGCAPTAAGNVIKYWADHDYPSLFRGTAPAQGGPSWEKLVNDLHVYFHTFDDQRSGSTYSNDVGPGLTRYALGIGRYAFKASTSDAFSWSAYTGQIDANRPVVLMFQNLNVTAPSVFNYGDHAVTGIGYDHTPGDVASEYMIIHDNWPAYPADVYVQFNGPNATYASREMVAFGPVAAPAGPANDAFASAQTLSGASGSVSGTSVGATKESGEPSHAGSAGGASIWYRWTASASGTLTVDTLGSGFDTVLAAYTGTSVSALTSIASNNDFGSGQQSRVAFRVTAGTTYRIAVDGWSGASGLVSLNWAFAAVPVAPDTVTATIDTATAGPVVQGTTVAFSGHATDSLGHGVSVYEWTSSIDGALSAAASFSTSSLSAGTHTIGFRARCSSGTWSAQRTVTLKVTAPPSAPANDAFDAPQALTGVSGTVSGTNVGATKETGEPSHAGDPGGASVWYDWVAPSTGRLSVDTSGSGFATVLAAYMGTSVDTLTQVAVGGVASADATRSPVVFNVRAGVAYRIAVDGSGGASGAVKLDWSFLAPVASSNTVHLSVRTLSRNHYVTITGAFRPATSGESVRVEVLKPGSRTWVRVVTRTTNSRGTWTSYRYKATLRGTYRIRTRFLADFRYKTSTSAYARLTVR